VKDVDRAAALRNAVQDCQLSQVVVLREPMTAQLRRCGSTKPSTLLRMVSCGASDGGISDLFRANQAQAHLVFDFEQESGHS